MSDVFPENLKTTLWNVSPKGDRNTRLMVTTKFGRTSLMIISNNNRVFLYNIRLGAFAYMRNLLNQVAAQGKPGTFLRPAEEYKDRERKRIGDIGVKLDDQLNAFFMVSCAAGSWEFPIYAPQPNFGGCENVAKVDAARMMITEWADEIIEKGRFLEILTGTKMIQKSGGAQSNAEYTGNSSWGTSGGGSASADKSLDDNLPF